MPAVPTPSRRRSPSRSTAITGAVAASAGLALLAAVPAVGDTVRLEGVPESTFTDSGLIQDGSAEDVVTEVPARGDEPRTTPAPKPSRVARIAITAADGTTRRLGPFRLPEPVAGVTASPDGRHLLLSAPTQDEDSLDLGLYAVPVDGGTPKRIALPKNAFPLSLSPPAFTPDGAELLLSDVLKFDPKARPNGENPASPALNSYRCALASGACAPFGPGNAGVAVGFPGGTLTATSLSSGLSDIVTADLFVDNGVASDDWVARDSRTAKAFRDFVASASRSTVAVQGTSARTISDLRRTPTEGVPVAMTAVGGPSGALVTRVTVRIALQRRKDEVRLAGQGAASRLMTVRPDGTSTVGPVPRVTVDRAALRRVDRRYAGARPTLPFTPAVDRADGSWLGVAGDPQLELEGDDGLGGSSENDAEAVVLAVLDASGVARTVRVGGRDATAETLLRYVPRAGRVEATGALEVLGYERATRTAVVRVRWQAASDKRRTGGEARSTALRVPLDGAGRPTVLTGGVQAAW